ncbi:MAG: hypothetical protein JW839_03965 [Candidatus Lokiarchaeota archaeon]|nr:hypothetical protein [Candidatus Lokiarchaeota archaeon]
MQMGEASSKTKGITEPGGQNYEKVSYYLIKSLVFLGFFSFVHFAWELMPVDVVLFFSANDESVFSHAKMALYAWLFTCAVEFAWLLRGPRVEDKRSFVLSRLLVAVLLPWFEVLVWYVVPGIVKAELPLYLELPWAFAVVYIIGVLGGGLERVLQNSKLDTFATAIVLVLFGLSVFFFTAFTWEKPWIDFFYLP